jgi:LysR family glycine cleavage system transcriptional activator
MSRRLPPLNALRVFETAARLMSFNRAAEELQITPSAVSHQIRGLERFLGLRLFRRANRTLMLTDEGQNYLPTLREAFDAIHAATARLGAPRSGGTLTVSLLSSFAVRWLIPRLPRFQALHPEIEVRLSTATRLVDFRREDVDCAIRYGGGNWPGLAAYRLVGDDIFPVTSPRLLRGPQTLASPADLAHHTLLQSLAWREGWRQWLTAARAAGAEPGEIDPERGPQFETTDLALAAAAEGHGIAIGRTALVAEELRAGRLVALFDMRLSVASAYYLVMPEERREQPRLADFRAWLLAEGARDSILIEAA